MTLRTALRFCVANLETLARLLRGEGLLGPESDSEVAEVLNRFKYKFEEDLKFDSFISEVQSEDPLAREIQKRKVREFELFLRDSVQVSYRLHR